MNDGQVSVDGRTYPLEAPVPGDRDAEPRGALRHLPAARVADGPLPAAHPHGLPVARGRAAHPAGVAGARRATRWPGSAPCCASPTCARCRRRPTASTSSPSSPTTSSASRARRGSRRTSRSASRRAAQLAWRNAARAAALADGRDYVLPDDLKALALPALAHRLVAASPAEARRARAPGRRARPARHPRARARAGLRPRARAFERRRRIAALARRVRGWLGPRRRFPPTREGWWFLIATLLLGLAPSTPASTCSSRSGG